MGQVWDSTGLLQRAENGAGVVRPGGVWGYEEFLEAIRDPAHPEHAAMLEWVGGAFDPEDFDLGAVNDQLAHLGPSPWDG